MSPEPAATTLLAIPCYQHGDALAAYLNELCPALATLADSVRLIVVDDGSPADDQGRLAARIDALRATYPFLQPLVALPTNRGKGHAIRTGWATRREEKWLAFVDADGAVPAAAVVTLLSAAQRATAPSVFAAVRAPDSGQEVRRWWYRRLGSRVFNAWVRAQLRLTLTDTQCGLKVIPATLHTLAPWREDGFAFDLELLLRARDAGLPVQTQPIAWHEQPGSTLGWRATLDLFAAARRLRSCPPA